MWSSKYVNYSKLQRYDVSFLEYKVVSTSLNSIPLLFCFGSKTGTSGGDSRIRTEIVSVDFDFSDDEYVIVKKGVIHEVLRIE